MALHPRPTDSRRTVPDLIVTRNGAGLSPTRAIRDEASAGSHASLIQSAARSILDSAYTPTSTNVSDDENDDDGYSHHQEQNLVLQSLESLQQVTPPAMPDEQDRKRFVGCLAAILASAYDYDVTSNDEDSDAHKAESYAYLTRNEQGHDSDDEIIRNNSNNGNAPRENDASRLDASTIYDETDDDPFLVHACSTSFEYFDTSTLPDISLSRTPASDLKATRQNRQGDKKAPLKKSVLARNRHRKRRYDVLSSLLLNSAELLLLDKREARAFLPMLAQLLVPPSAFQKTTERQTRQRTQLHKQKMQQQKASEYEGKNLPSFGPTTPTKSTIDATPKLPDKGINHYHFSPSTTMPVGRDIPLVDSYNPQNQNTDTAQYLPDDDDNSLLKHVDEDDYLRPFLESLSPGAGFRCLSLLLLQHLLNSGEGYDARVRHVIKKLGVVVLLHDMDLELDMELATNSSVAGEESKRRHTSAKSCRRRSRKKSRNYRDLVGPATRKFEALEHSIAVRLIRLSKEQERLQKQYSQSNTKRNGQRQKASNAPPEVVAPAFSREQLVRGLKIGSAGLVAGTIFAVTGGLAAPGIAAGVAAFAGSTAATAAVAAIVSSTPAVTAIFGVGGGSLAAYKMNRRTQGLTEFEFRRQDKLVGGTNADEVGEEEEQAELFSTVCISGWLRDGHDFQRPWGVTPSNPRIRDRLELLERFYSVHRPEHVRNCRKILASWKGEEQQLWLLLRQKYGRDPDHLFPIDRSGGDGFHRGLTLEQEEVLDDLFLELGYVAVAEEGEHSDSKCSPPSAFEKFRERLRHPFSPGVDQSSRRQNANECDIQARLSTNPEEFYQNSAAFMDETMHNPLSFDGVSEVSSGFDSVPSSHATNSTSKLTTNSSEEEKMQYMPPKHLATVWDYHTRYGGDLYTVKWESEMLIELCDSVTDLAFDVINGATTQLLRQTALSTLLSAVALPYALVNAANMIDGTWTLAVERADEAGKELARSLLYSRAGHRPVTLVGFSFGARVIYSCLKELARYQEKWETSRENNTTNPSGHTSEYSWTMREPASIVEDAIVMGLPNHLSLSSWKACRQVVSGRLVNCYSRKDLILSLMFQFKRLAGVLRPVCGTSIVNVHGVENVDVSDLISNHQEYCLATGEILKRVRHGQPFRTSVDFGTMGLLSA